MGPVSAPVSNSVNLGGVLAKNLDQIGSKSDTEVKSRAKTDGVQPQGVELARGQQSASTGRDQRRGSLLDVSV